MSLFREEAQNSHRPKLYGEIVLYSSWQWWALTCAVLVFVVGLLALVFYGEYTRRAAVSGYLTPVAGVLRVYSQQGGRASKVWVKEGDVVSAGQALLTVVDERADATGHDALGLGTRQLEARASNLRDVIAQQRSLYQHTRDALLRRINSLEQEIAQLQIEQKTQLARLAYARRTQLRYAELEAEKFVSALAVQEKQEVVADQEARLQVLERTQTQLVRDLDAARSDLAQIPMREKTQVAELERTLNGTQQDLIDLGVKRELVVTSPQAGRISGLTIQPGQVVGTERALMMLLPKGSDANTEGDYAEDAGGSLLEAHLFAQSKDAGFVREGQVVFLRYSAYPYQKFGHYRAKVIEVARTPLLPAELPFPIAPKVETGLLSGLIGGAAPASSAGSAEPLFRIRVALEHQYAKAYGVNQPLQSGMQLDADIMLDTRTIFEWVMEPVYSLRGKYFSGQH